MLNKSLKLNERVIAVKTSNNEGYSMTLTHRKRLGGGGGSVLKKLRI